MNKMENEKTNDGDGHPGDGDTAPGPASEGQRPAEASPNGKASPADETITMIRIEEIHVLNPRQRDKKEFEQIVLSIKNQGLKMPIQVSRREEHEPAGSKYDLVCGQGRMEAFIALGYREIPARVVAMPKEERMICSLVENIARRKPAPMDLIR